MATKPAEEGGKRLVCDRRNSRCSVCRWIVRGRRVETHLSGVVASAGVDSHGDVGDETLLDNSAELLDLESWAVAGGVRRGETVSSKGYSMECCSSQSSPVLVRVLVDLKGIVPVASATPLINDGVGVVRPHLCCRDD